MDRKIFEQFIGKQVELFIEPEIPRTSGTLISCEDDHIVLGDEAWSYSAVMGIRALKKNSAGRQRQRLTYAPEIKNSGAENLIPVQEAENKNKTESRDEAAEIPEIKNEAEPEPETKAKQETLPVPEDFKGREFEGVIAVFYPEKNWGFIESE